MVVDIGRTLSDDAALVIVDMQEDFCGPKGALSVHGGRELAASINKLSQMPFKLKIATQDYHPADHCSFASQHERAEPFTSLREIRNPDAAGDKVETQTIMLWPDHCVQDTKGVEIIPELELANISHVIRKGEDKRVESYSAFGPPFRRPAVGMSKLQQVLKEAGIRRVFACGLAFDYCVKHTAIDAAEAGFDTIVVEDATRAVNADNWSKTSAELEKKQVRLVRLAQLSETIAG